MPSSPPKTPRRGVALLRAWRENKGLKQAEACVLVSLDPQTYNGIEHGRITPGLKRAYAIERGTDGAVPVQSWMVDDRRRRRAA